MPGPRFSLSIQNSFETLRLTIWVPAFAGMSGFWVGLQDARNLRAHQCRSPPFSDLAPYDLGPGVRRDERIWGGL